MGEPATPAARVPPVYVVLPFLVGAVVAVLLGVYARVHDPTGDSVFDAFFSTTISMKAWVTTIVLVFVLFQGFSALRLYGKISFPRELPSWFGDSHRLSGTIAFILSLPVAYHCLWALGFETGTFRVYVHSVVGLIFYGAFAAKILVVRDHRLPGWMLPTVGGVTFAALIILWLTASLWFFTNPDLPLT